MPMLKRADAEIYYEVHGAGFPILLYAPGGLHLADRDVGRCVAQLSQRLPVDGSAHGARRQVHRDRHGPAQRRQVGGRRQARPWLAHLRRRPSGADRPSRLQEVPRHGRLHRRQLLLRGDRAGARPRRRGGAAEPDRPVGEPRHLGRRRKGLRRDGARPRSRRSRSRPSTPSARTCSAPISCSPSPATSSRTAVRRSSCSPAPTSRIPAHTSEEIAALAPNIEVQKDWKGPTFLQESIKRVHGFLAKHTPK